MRFCIKNSISQERILLEVELLWLYLLLPPLSIYYFWRSKQYMAKASQISDSAEAVALRRLGVRNRRTGQIILTLWLIALIAALLFILSM